MSDYLILLGLMFCASGLFGQESDLNFNFQKITLEDGLSTNSYNDYIYQDSRGFVWISSTDGINRFDGVRIKQYSSGNGMKGTNIQSNFFEDSDGNIWFSTFTGINCYKNDLDSIIHIPICFDSGELVENGFKVFHFNDKKQEIWLKGSDRIFKISTKNPLNYEMLNLKIDGFHFNVSENATTQDVEKIVVSPWYGKGIKIINLENEKIKNVATYLEDYEGIRKSIFLAKKKLLLFTKNNLFIFNEKEPNIIKFLKNEPTFNFYDVIKISKKNLLIATLNHGLWLYDFSSQKFIKQWKNTKNNSHSLSSNTPRFLYWQNNYLFTSSNFLNVNYAHIHSNPFKNPMQNFNTKVTFLKEDSKQMMWCSGNNQEITKIHTIPSSLSNYYTMQKIPIKKHLIEVKEGVDKYFFGHTKDSLFYLTEELEKLENIHNADTLQFKYQISFFPNRTIITTSKGIKEIVKDNIGKFKIISCPEFTDIDKFNVLKIFAPSERKIYIPYDASELWIYSATVEGLKEIAKLPCQMMLHSLVESKKYRDVIWASTSEGLQYILKNTIIKPVFKANSDIASKEIFGLIEDEDGYLWFTTSNALWKYDPSTGLLERYEEEDGLIGNVFYPYNSATLSSQNEIWLGTNKGLTTFDPQKIKPYDIPPKVYIDHLLINDETEVKGIGVKDELVLEHDQSTLLFDVIPVLLYKADRAKVNYRLVNYDGNWLSVKNGQKIRYTKIPPGKYTFEVMAEDVNGNQSEVKQLAITIHPHFTQTWWFYLLATFVTGLLMYALYRYRVAQIREVQAKKTAIAQLELQVAENELKALRAQMNPHFLFNAMNSIKGIIIQQEVNQAIEYLTKFSMLIRTILSNSEKKSILLKNELEALQLYIELEALRFTESFKFQINVDRTVDKTYVRIPPLILQPFVENAIWHGLMPKADADNKLLINIFRKADFVLCEIEDNGIGRKKAKERTKAKKHNSMGIGITEKRIKMLHPDNEVFIVDLEDGAGQGTGTKVIVKIFAPD